MAAVGGEKEAAEDVASSVAVAAPPVAVAGKRPEIVNFAFVDPEMHAFETNTKRRTSAIAKFDTLVFKRKVRKVSLKLSRDSVPDEIKRLKWFAEASGLCKAETGTYGPSKICRFGEK